MVDMRAIKRFLKNKVFHWKSFQPNKPNDRITKEAKEFATAKGNFFFFKAFNKILIQIIIILVLK